ncbi:MAG: type IX secretion system membrane protein PorP/SprF [bacterium]|jgi:type IX secretion system PorP/SprF family membrane protein
MRNYIYTIHKHILAVALIIGSLSATAQLNPSPSQYYFNQMVQSVAATGLRDMARVDASFRNMVPNTFTGSPVNQYVTLQTQTAKGAGLGVQFNGDNAGLLSRNRLLGSYALDLSKGSTRVRLGVGIGMMMNRINSKGGALIRGDVNDPVIASYNQQRVNVDGTVGVMIETAKGIQLLTSVPSLGNIQEFSKYGAVNYTVFNAMLTKKFSLTKGGETSGKSTISPMLGYRMIHGGEDVVDMGALINVQEWIGFMAMYHTNKEFALGVNLPYKDKLMFNFTYNTGKVYSNTYLNVGGTLEGHVMIKLGGKK